jgi:hypothetical protein
MYTMCPGGTVVQHSAHNPRIKGSYPASGTGREKIAKFNVFSNKDR